jgi:hypothetical protein
MNDSDTPAPGYGEADGGATRPREDPLTGLLRSDAVIMMLARNALADSGGSGGELAARRALDGEIRAMITWPTGEDYLAAADDFARAGRAEDAALLRRVAGTDLEIAVTRTQWNIRYDDRPAIGAQELITALRRDGRIHFDPAAPYFGVDGAVYEPGVLAVGTDDKPVVVVTGRGSSELLIDWPGYAAMSEWIAGRGSTASGELSPPPVHSDCRAWQEDTVLARLAGSPRDVPLIARDLLPDTFTTDVRYEVYEAVRVLYARGKGYTAEEIGAELTRRMASVPPYGLANYGGASAPWAHAYVARLSATDVTREEALSAARAVVHDDEHDRARAARPQPAPGREPAHGHRHAGDRTPAARQEAGGQVSAMPQLRPPAVPGPGNGPAQRF